MNKNTDILTRLFFETFFKHVDVSNIRLHVICRSLDISIMEYIERRKLTSNCEFFIYEIPPAIDKDKDVARMIHWMVENCGNEEWVIVSHNDVYFHGDVVSLFSSYMSDHVGQIGNHNFGVVAYNRSAYRNIRESFESYGGFYVYPLACGDYKLLHMSDPRANDRLTRLQGFDVGELYILKIQANLFSYEPLGDKYCTEDSRLDDVCTHIGGQALHDNEQIADDLFLDLMAIAVCNGVNIDRSVHA